MAPIPRQPTLTPLIPRPTLDTPSTPVQVTSFIPRKLFLQLFAGTVCIFILTVLVWKFPRFFRSFTKNKVLREGNATTTRYAKTWYGWVPLRRHEANKRALRNFMAKLKSWTAWGSSRVDFQWIWWDPGERKFGTYQERGKGWLPTWTRSSCFTTADTMWNLESAPRRSAVTNSSQNTPSSPSAAGAPLPLDLPRLPRPVAVPRQRFIHTNTSLQGDYGGAFSAIPSRALHPRHADFAASFESSVGWYATPPVNGKFRSLSRLVHFRNFHHALLGPLRSRLSIPQSFSTPCFSQPPYPSTSRGPSPKEACNPGCAGSGKSPREFLAHPQRSRNYQIWSARMGLQTLRGIGYSTSTFPRSPPGTPQTAFLGSVSFEGTAYGRAGQYQQKLKQASSSGISDLSLDSGEHQHNARSPGQTSRSKSEADVPNARYVSQLYTPPTSFRPPMPVCRRRDLQGCQKKIAGKDRTKRAPSHCLVQVKDWSNWEVRLLDSLDRRLEWLSCQLSPGRRTYHFALLANHWLNAETWIVYDPISRVSIDSRRRLGDPRFNVPYPTPDWTPRPKYPKAHHRLAQTPKINSWRAAMNRNRRASGLREFIKGIELYDSSAEDPPDGKVDPASWILRKPPQGYALSIRQAEAYYEGGAGWQEKLSDWQKVRRGYRVRKAIHEGRVNRTRVKEIAYAISRCCQQATLRLFPPEDGREGSEEPSAEDMP